MGVSWIQSTLKDTIVAEVPKPAITWGAAGLLPYAGTAAASIHFARQAYLANEGLRTFSLSLPPPPTFSKTSLIFSFYLGST